MKHLCIHEYLIVDRLIYKLAMMAPQIRYRVAVYSFFLFQASRQFDMEGRKKFFTLDMNNILQE